MKRLLLTYAAYTFTFFFLASVLPADLFLKGFGVLIAGCLIVACFNYPSIRRNLNHVEQRGRPGWLYGFFDRGNFLPVVKIGRESARHARLRQHKTAAPLGIRIVFSFSVRDTVYAERFLHYRYAYNRLEGNEWFFYTPVMFFEILLLRIFGA